MHISNMCTNDLRKKKVSNMNTVGEIIVTKEVTFWQPSARAPISPYFINRTFPIENLVNNQ